MSNSKISLYERFVFSKNTTSFLSSLVKNSDDYWFYYLLNELNSKGLNLTNEDKETLDQYVSKRSHNKENLIVLYQKLLRLEEIQASGESPSLLKKELHAFASLYLSVQFNYPRPPAAYHHGDREDPSLKGSFSSCLTSEELSLSGVIESATDRLEVTLLRPCALVGLDPSILLSKKVVLLEQYLQAVPTFAPLGNQLPKLLAKHYRRCEKENCGTNVMGKAAYDRMTVEQMKKLSQEIPTLMGDHLFVGQWFQKVFEKEVRLLNSREDMARSSYEELCDVYQRLYQWANALGSRPVHKSLAAVFLLHQLVLSFNHGKVEEKTFRLYLKNPLLVKACYNYKWRSWCGDHTDTSGQSWLSSLGIPQLNVDDSFEEEYLLSVFSQTPENIDMSYYEKYFSVAVLQVAVYKARVFNGIKTSPTDCSMYFSSAVSSLANPLAKLLDKIRGKEPTTIPTDEFPLDDNEKERLHNLKQLCFARGCRRYFTPDEPVELTLMLKNISELSVRVFEVQTEQYYRQFEGKDTLIDIPVDGLIPSRSEVMTFSKPPSVIHHVPLKDVTARRRGAYVVDCMGSGVRCRAVVRVGALTLLWQYNLSKGLVYFIVDEAKRLCKGKDTYIRLGEKVYRPLEELGHGILIPYGVEEINTTAVVCHDGFADICEVNIPKENPMMQLTVVVHEGTVLESGYVKLLVSPKVTNGGMAVNTSTLRNAAITVSSVDVNGVRSSQTYKNISLSGLQPTLEVSYLVPSFTETLRVELQAQMYSQSAEKWIDLGSSREVRIERMNHVKVYADVVLRAEDDNHYVLQYLGKDGEPYTGMRVNIVLESHFTSRKIEHIRCTDLEGKIQLGDIRRYASSLTVFPIDTPSPEHFPEKTFDLNSGRSCGTTETLVDCLLLVRGESATFPALDDTEEVEGIPLVLLTRVLSDDRVVETKKVKRVGNVYVCKDLEVGQYRLDYLLQERRVSITVVEGHPWEEAPGRYVALPNRILERGSLSSGLSASCKVKADGKVRIVVDPCGGRLEAVRVHALAYVYYPTTLGTVKLALHGSPSSSNLEFPLRFRGVEIQNPTQLDEESKYILDRKGRRTVVGNTLEKPPGLLKRHLVRDTTESEAPEYKEEIMEVYEAPEPTGLKDMVAQTNSVMPHFAKRKKRALFKSSGAAERTPMDFAGDMCMAEDACYAPCAPAPPMALGQMMAPVNRKVSARDYGIEDMTRFLKYGGWVEYNKKPDEKGVVEFAVPQGCGYSTLVYVVHDGHNCTVGVTSLKGEVVPKRPLALPSSRAADRIYSTERRSENLEKGSVLSLPSTATFSLVDSVAAAVKCMQLLNPNTGLSNRWSFLSLWGMMTPLRKLEKYNELACHEFNCFVYFKDREFFDEVVRPYLSSKSKKQIIDWLLLGSAQDVMKYLSTIPSSSLNAMECALIVALLHTNEPEYCRRIAADLSKRVSAVNDSLSEEKETRFDCVLSGGTHQEEHRVEGGNEPVVMESGDSRSIEIATLTGKRFPLVIRPGETVQDLIDKIEAREGIPSDQIRLIFDGKQLAREALLSEYNITEDSVVHMVLRLRGNGSGEKEELKEVCAPGGKMELVGGEEVLDALDLRQKRYRSKGTTKEYEETQYDQGRSAPPIKGLPFWADLANHFTSPNASKPFLTESFIYVADSVTEGVIALSVLDIPLVKRDHTIDRESTNLSIRVASPSIAFFKTLEEKGKQEEEEESNGEIIMSQRFVDPSDMHLIDPVKNVRTIKTVKEFIVGKLYACRVSATNTSDSSCTVRLVTEVPQGAVPVMSTEPTKDQEKRMEPLMTVVEMFYFYFPREGTFTCMPACVNEGGRRLGSVGDLGTLRVVKVPEKKEMATFVDVLTHGNSGDILDFIKKNNWYDVRVFSPVLIYWLLPTEGFYKGLIPVLRERGIFDEVVWSFSIYHGDYATFCEYLQYLEEANKLTNAVFSKTLFFKTKSLTLDRFEFLEYSPLANARAHDVGKYKHNIRNDAFRETYEQFLQYWVEKSPHNVTEKDRLYLTSYLLLQDRVEEAMTVYDKIHVKALTEEQGEQDMKLQYDYLAAYLDIYRGGPTYSRAREVCVQYLAYPVLEWRNRFIDVLNLLAECDGEERIPTQGEETDQNKNAREAEREPTLDCAVKVEEGVIALTVQRVKKVTVSALEVDLELLFSENPFLNVSEMNYDYLIPNWKTTREVESGESGIPEVMRVDLPKEIKHHNLLLRVDAGPLSKTIPYIPCEMLVQIRHEYGTLRVTDRQNPHRLLPRVYVKVYAKYQGGDVRFFKDAYTDLRGCVEYTSVNHTTDFSQIERFSILVLSEENGAKIVETRPPTCLGTLEVTSRELVSTAMQMQLTQMARSGKNRYNVV